VVIHPTVAEPWAYRVVHLTGGAHVPGVDIEDVIDCYFLVSVCYLRHLHPSWAYFFTLLIRLLWWVLSDDLAILVDRDTTSCQASMGIKWGSCGLPIYFKPINWVLFVVRRSRSLKHADLFVFHLSHVFPHLADWRQRRAFLAIVWVTVRRFIKFLIGGHTHSFNCHFRPFFVELWSFFHILNCIFMKLKTRGLRFVRIAFWARTFCRSTPTARIRCIMFRAIFTCFIVSERLTCPLCYLLFELVSKLICWAAFAEHTFFP